jgi:hypothetical protein
LHGRCRARVGRGEEGVSCFPYSRRAVGDPFLNIIVLKVQISDADHKTKPVASQAQSLDSLKSIQWSCVVVF